jgi:KaiC/GvpD/RAD55 family RecA-like ATPase
VDELTPPEAKSVSAGVRPIPFGMPALDASLGGLPSGTSALLAGAPDAGADAFVYTHAAQLMLARHDPELYPADVGAYRDTLPERVVYVSFGTAGKHVLNAMDAVLDQYQFDALVDHLTLLDYSGAFLDLVDTPAAFDHRSGRGGPLDAVERRDGDDSFPDLVGTVSADLDDHGERAVVVVDSLSDLYLARRFGLAERTLLGFCIGLREMAVDWNGLVHVLYNQRAEGVRADQVLNTLLHGNVYFYSNDQGFDTYRTMRVGSFGGALDRESQVVFGTSIGAAGFRVKSTKKVGPSNW